MLRAASAALALLAAPAAQAACGADGATYVPRPAHAADGIRYRLTTLPPVKGAFAYVGERYRFDLFAQADGRRLSRIDFDYICGVGRAPCKLWPLGGEDSFHTSTVIRLNADFTLAVDNGAPFALVFVEFSEHDWTTPLTLRKVPGVRYFTRARVPPDLSAHTMWVRAACGR